MLYAIAGIRGLIQITLMPCMKDLPITIDNRTLDAWMASSICDEAWMETMKNRDLTAILSFGMDKELREGQRKRNLWILKCQNRHKDTGITRVTSPSHRNRYKH